MMNIATIHYIAQPDFINMSLFLFFLNSAKYFIQECTWRGSCKPKNILQKLLQTEKKPKTNEKKKRYKLYKEIAIDNKISPPWEANLSPTQSLDFCGFFVYLDAVITNI